VHPENDFCLQARLPWSKNVRDPRDSPWQLVVASNDWRLDVVLHFAQYFEVIGDRTTWQQSPFTFVESGDSWERVKGRACTAMKDHVVDNEQFKQIFARTGRGAQASSAASMAQNNAQPKRLGSHSVRKFAKTRARRRGNCSKDDSDIRGRWKTDDAKASSRYEDTYLPFPDAKVAFALAFGGPIKYVLTENSYVSDEWIAAEVSPNTAAVFGTNVASLLGKALLWACYDDEAKSRLDPNLCQRVTAAYQSVHQAAVGQAAAPRAAPASVATAAAANAAAFGEENDFVDTTISNPVAKFGLTLYEQNGMAVIGSAGPVSGNATVPRNVNAAGNANATTPGQVCPHCGCGGPTTSGCSDAGLRGEVVEIRREMASQSRDIKNIQNQQRIEFDRQAERERRNDRLLRRVANFPLVRRRRDNTNTTNEESEGEAENQSHINQQLRPDATLSKCPRDLYLLWQEYEHGLDGRHAAKTFSEAEKGRVTSSYSKRNKVWKTIQRLINSRGVHHNIAIDTIYEVYGNISVTKIIKAIQRDEKTGGHPRLR